jgi:methionyl-tRNA synthetase
MTGRSFYLTTPIYYVNSVPHLGTAYTTVAADARPIPPFDCGDDVFFLTGLDEHGQKVEQAARERHGSAAGVVRLGSPSSSRATWGRSTSPTTTSSAPPSRATSAPCSVCAGAPRSRRHLQGHYEGWYCVPDETYWAEDQLESRAAAPVRAPVEFVREDNYFFKLSAYADRCSSPLRGAARLHPARDPPQRGLSFVKGGLRDLSISRANVKWGVPLPWDESHTMYVWFDALINYITAVGYGDPIRAEEFARAGLRRSTSSARTSSGSTASSGPRCSWPPARGARGVFAHGFLLTKGEKMSKSKGNAHGARRARRALRRGRVPLLLPARRAVRGGRLDLARVDGAALQRRPRQRLGQPLLAALQHGRQVLRRRGPDPRGAGPTRRRPTWRAGCAARSATSAMASSTTQARSRPRGTSSRRRTATSRTRRRGTSPSPRRREPRLATVLYNALEAVRIAALFTAPVMPATSAEVWRSHGLGDIAMR